MKKGLFCAVVIVVFCSMWLSGCQDTSSVKTQQQPKNVYLDSTIVEFANVTFDKKINEFGSIEAVTVSWLFHNIAGRLISAKINVQFYDKNNLILYNESKNIKNMPEGFTERLLGNTNQVTYVGAEAATVDHVIISVTEI